MKEAKTSLQWAEQTLRGLSEQGFTGSVTVRLSQGGIQGIAVNQELNPRQPMVGAGVAYTVRDFSDKGMTHAPKEDGMKVWGFVAVGFLSAMAAIGLGTASGSAADATQSGLVEERVGHGGSLYTNTSTATRSTPCAAAQSYLVEERIGHGGSILHSKTTGDCALLAEDQTKGPLVEERIGHGGSVYVRPAARQAVN